MTTNSLIRSLRCPFSDVEKLELSRELAEANKSLDELQDEKKQFNSSIKGRIDSTTAKIRTLSNEINCGYEFRPIECHWRMNSPESGKKTLYRDDDGGVVETTQMTEAEMQPDFFGNAIDVDATKESAELV